MKMKIVATTLLLSSSVNIVRGRVLPPGQGYEDAYCAPGSCLLYKNPLGLYGMPRIDLWKCYDEKTGNTSEAVWTGSMTNVKPPNSWTKNPEKCQDSDKKKKMDPAKQQKFADELTTSLYSKPNECTSSLSVSMVFSLLYPGATNDGIAAMRNTFGYPDGSNMQLVWQETSERMLKSANGTCLKSDYDGTCVYEAPLLKFANSVWLDKSETLNKDYEEIVGEYAMHADFESPDSSTRVNEWVNKSTNGLIDSIVPQGPLSPATLLAINSIYLKAKWSDPTLFHAYNTKVDAFYASPSRSKNVSDAHFMSTVKFFHYSHDALKGYQTISLPLAESSMSMLFVLPLADGAGAVNTTDVIGAYDKLESTRVALSLPKFNFESKYKNDLMEALSALGLNALFTGSESLCGLDFSCLSISRVIQKTSIAVDEKGVEAAATTAVTTMGSGAPPTDPPILMKLDHPFQFFIYNEKEKLTLFEGRLGLPEAPSPSTPLLDAKRFDSDFWQANFGVNPVDPPAPVATTSVLQSW
mmetsp:Transcript_1167/g.2147  ORF Transcript_1167/g.2147 Transcript_1167/m.2147 type:complete len:525 (-) Transcript_1167:58-1632(-)